MWPQRERERKEPLREWERWTHGESGDREGEGERSTFPPIPSPLPLPVVHMAMRVRGCIELTWYVCECVLGIWDTVLFHSSLSIVCVCVCVWGGGGCRFADWFFGQWQWRISAIINQWEVERTFRSVYLKMWATFCAPSLWFTINYVQTVA